MARPGTDSELSALMYRLLAVVALADSVSPFVAGRSHSMPDLAWNFGTAVAVLP